MIIIFDDGVKVNFVDENNVFIGYDLSQDCCEHASWFISNSIQDKIPDDSMLENMQDLKNYVIDKSFIKEITGDFLDEGQMIVIRIYDDNKEKFIHIFNSHNGYYSHGFEIKDAGKLIKEGYL